MANQGTQSTNLPKGYNLDVEGRRSTWDKTYLGFVKDLKDDKHMNRLRVWIPELCASPDDPKASPGTADYDKYQDTWIVVDYASPFGGSGHGFVAVPQLGTQVICMFINGDPNRGIWLACLFDVNGNHMVPSIPATDNIPREEMNKKTGVTPPLTAREIQMGDAGTNKNPIDANGSATRGMGNSWTVNGWSTPSRHNFVMDDDIKDGYVRLQTRNGSTILMHNNNRIIISPGNNLSRIELDDNGNVKIYGHNDVSIAADGYLNLTGKNGVNIEAEAGDINIHSSAKTHIYSEKEFHLKSNSNMLMTSNGEMHRLANGNIFDTAAGNGRIQLRANCGILNTVTGGNIENYANGNIHTWANSGTVDIRSDKDMRIESLTQLNIKSRTDTRIQANGNVDLFVLGNINASSSGNSNLSSGGWLKLESQSRFDVKTGGVLNLQAGGQMAIKTPAKILVQGGGQLDLFAIDGFVNTGPSTHIDKGGFVDPVPNAEPASEIKVEQPTAAPRADPEARAITETAAYADYAMTAEEPKLNQHAVQDISSSAMPNRVTSIVNSVVSPGGRPGADPEISRNRSSPGYSNTGTVDTVMNLQIDAPEKKYKTGQVLPPITDSSNKEVEQQKVPLQFYGPVKGGDAAVFFKQVGNKWNDTTPVYTTPEAIDNILYRKAIDWRNKPEDTTGLRLLTSEAGIVSLQDHEGKARPPARDGYVFDPICPTGQLMIGHGHVLSADEKQPPSSVEGAMPAVMNIGGKSVSWQNGLSKDQMLQLLRDDIDRVEKQLVSRLGDSLITQGQLDALVDFTFLVTANGLDRSGIIGFIKSGDYDKVPTEMVKWVVACGEIRADLRARQLENALKWSGQSSISSQYAGSTSPVSQDELLQYINFQGGGYNTPENYRKMLPDMQNAVLDLAKDFVAKNSQKLVLNSNWRPYGAVGEVSSSGIDPHFEGYAVDMPTSQINSVNLGNFGLYVPNAKADPIHVELKGYRQNWVANSWGRPQKGNSSLGA